METSRLVLTPRVNFSSENKTQDRFVQFDASVFNYINFGILILLLPCVVFGNITVLASIIRFRKLHTCMNLLIANLAIGDLLVGFPTCPLYASMYIYSGLSKNKWVCLARSTAVIASFSCTLITLAVISVERYLAVFHPLHYKYLVTKTKVKIAISAVWVYVIPISAVPLFGFNTWSQFHACEYFDLLPKAFTITAFVITMAVSFPTAAILFSLTTCKIRTVQKRVKTIKSLQHRGQETKRDKEKKAGIMMAFIFMLFVIFWIPFAVVIPLRYMLREKHPIEEIKNLTVVLAMGNSAVNPIVYCWCKEDFRASMSLLIFGNRRKYKPETEDRKTEFPNRNDFGAASKIFFVL